MNIFRIPFKALIMRETQILTKGANNSAFGSFYRRYHL